MKPVTREVLDSHKCDNDCGRDHEILYLWCRKCQESSMVVSYRLGILVLVCNECGRHVVTIAVASEREGGYGAGI